MSEERYTRAEWDEIQRREKCDQQGHDYKILVAVGNKPEGLLCERCGLSWEVKHDA